MVAQTALLVSHKIPALLTLQMKLGNQFAWKTFPSLLCTQTSSKALGQLQQNNYHHVLVSDVSTPRGHKFGGGKASRECCLLCSSPAQEQRNPVGIVEWEVKDLQVVFGSVGPSPSGEGDSGAGCSSVGISRATFTLVATSNCFQTMSLCSSWLQVGLWIGSGLGPASTGSSRVASGLVSRSGGAERKEWKKQLSGTALHSVAFISSHSTGTATLIP